MRTVKETAIALYREHWRAHGGVSWGLLLPEERRYWYERAALTLHERGAL